MIFQYQRTGKVIEVLNDLIKIHNDRIETYRYALGLLDMDVSIYNIFQKTISESKYYREQLAQKIKELNGDPLKGSTVLGKIYRAWIALKVTLPSGTQKAMINSCLYNEEIALHAYNAALSSNVQMEIDVRQLIESQETALREIHAHISAYRTTRKTIEHRLAYFV